MKNLFMEYRLKISFDREINHHHFSLKCLPKSQPRQVINDMRVYIDADYFSFSRDCFGNRFWYGYKEKPHTELNVHIKAKAQVDWTVYDKNNRLNAIFLLPTKQTSVGENLLPFWQKCRDDCMKLHSTYAKALYIMQMVHDNMKYVPGATTIQTTADEAFSLRRGVCQDYAQIMVAIARKMNIPARYVAGVMQNEQLTHAWVEIFADGYWYGLDPTNNMLVSDIYIIFSRGRDYQDCLVNKGIFFSPEPAVQKQNILLTVKEI